MAVRTAHTKRMYINGALISPVLFNTTHLVKKLSFTLHYMVEHQGFESEMSKPTGNKGGGETSAGKQKSQAKTAGPVNVVKETGGIIDIRKCKILHIEENYLDQDLPQVFRINESQMEFFRSELVSNGISFGRINKAMIAIVRSMLEGAAAAILPVLESRLDSSYRWEELWREVKDYFGGPDYHRYNHGLFTSMPTYDAAEHGMLSTYLLILHGWMRRANVDEPTMHSAICNKLRASSLDQWQSVRSRPEFKTCLQAIQHMSSQDKLQCASIVHERLSRKRQRGQSQHAINNINTQQQQQQRADKCSRHPNANHTNRECFSNPNNKKGAKQQRTPKPTNGNGGRQDNDRNKRQRTEECFTCHRVGHQKNECPYREDIEALIKTKEAAAAKKANADSVHAITFGTMGYVEHDPTRVIIRDSDAKKSHRRVQSAPATENMQEPTPATATVDLMADLLDYVDPTVNNGSDDVTAMTSSLETDAADNSTEDALATVENELMAEFDISDALAQYSDSMEL